MAKPGRTYLLPGRHLWQRRAVAACLALVLLVVVAVAGADAYAHWRFGQVAKVNLHNALRLPNAIQRTSENILIVGNNTRTGLAPGDAQLFGSPQEVGGARSDVTMVLHLDPARGTVQLVLLSIIIVGQNILAAASDKRAEDTYNDAEAVLVQSEKIQEHLMGQDAAIGKLLERVEAIAAKMATATS